MPAILGMLIMQGDGIMSLQRYVWTSLMVCTPLQEGGRGCAIREEEKIF
jgi:hypothetical protein